MGKMDFLIIILGLATGLIFFGIFLPVRDQIEENKELLGLVWFTDKENGKEKAYKTIIDLLDIPPEKRLRYIQKNWYNKKIGYTKRRYRTHDFFLDYQKLREDESSLDGGSRSRRERLGEFLFAHFFLC